MFPSPIRLAQFIYRFTPLRFLQKFYFDVFAYLVRNKKAVIKIDGVIWELDLGEMIDLAIYLQKYEKEISFIIDHYCQVGWTVLDIGANIGVHTLRFAKAVGTEGGVFCFEPMAYAFMKLQRNLALNDFPHVTAFQLALSNKNLKRQLVDFRSSWRRDGKVLEKESIVDFQRLDDWSVSHDINKIDLIKLDVDGNEFEILEGGQRLLDRNRPILLQEVGAWHFKDSSKNPIKLLHELGYRFWDSKSFQEYRSVNALMRVLPESDPNMAVSINVIAAARFPFRKKTAHSW